MTSDYQSGASAIETSARICDDLAKKAEEHIDSPFGSIGHAAAVSRNAYENAARSIRALPDDPASSEAADETWDQTKADFATALVNSEAVIAAREAEIATLQKDATYWTNKCEEALKRSGENKARADAAEDENATLRAALEKANYALSCLPECGLVIHRSEANEVSEAIEVIKQATKRAREEGEPRFVPAGPEGMS